MLTARPAMRKHDNLQMASFLEFRRWLPEFGEKGPNPKLNIQPKRGQHKELNRAK